MSDASAGELNDIDHVIARLDEIVDWAIREPNRIGYFAAMYRKVTVAVRDAIVAGEFDDGPRMARFDRIFAERFIDAFDTWRAGRQPTESWAVAFDSVERRRLLIVQHLLLGMNAHINLDLGIAAANVAPGDQITSLQGDFDRINSVLAGLVDGFEADVGALSPWIGWLDRIGGRAEEHVVRFSIDVARDEAWRFAGELAPLAPIDQAKAIARVDRTTAHLGRVIRRPGLFLPLGLLLIRSRESNDIAEVINHLRN